MSNTVGLRFCPTEKEICEYYLWQKNFGTDTSDVDGIISTVTNIWSLDPWDLPSLSNWRSRSTNESGNPVWYIFGVKLNHQARTTISGRWSKTGDTKRIMRKRGNLEQIAEKRYFVFKPNDTVNPEGSKSDWILHEYSPTFLSPNDQVMRTYTICRLEFKGEETEISSSSAATQLEHSHFPIPLVVNSGGWTIGSENPSQFGSYLYEPNEAHLHDALQPFNNFSDGGWIDSWYND